MNKSAIWRTEEAQLLRQLRENAKTDSLVFARLNAISLAQLKELEGLGSGSFYNPHIKANTGIKLLKKLGHEWVPPEESLNTEPNLDSAAAAILAPSATTVLAPHQPRLRALSTPDHRPAFSHTSPVKAGALLLLGGLSWMTWHLLGHQATPHPNVVSWFGLNKAPLALDFAQNLSPDKTDDVARSSPNQNAMQRIQATPAIESSWNNTAMPEASTCDGQFRQASFGYEPANPIKAGNYIHFLASQDVSLCVRDQQNQLTSLELKAGTSRSVYGDPPFLVHSPKWSSLQVFFQGRPVNGIPDGSAHWLFKTRSL